MPLPALRAVGARRLDPRQARARERRWHDRDLLLHMHDGPQLSDAAHAPRPTKRTGQPTLRRRIKLGAFAALDQRITLRYTLTGMDLAETGDYIGHHLSLAGRTDRLFSDDAIALIHQVARGLPRAINNLAIQALIAAYADHKNIVDKNAARAAVTEVTAE